MGVDITAYAAYNDSGKWKMIPAYIQNDNGALEFPNVFPGRDSEFFSWMYGEKNGLGYGDFPEVIVERGIPHVAPDEVPSYVLEQYSMASGYVYNASYISLAEIDGLIQQMPKKVIEQDGKHKVKNDMRTELKWIRDNLSALADMAGLPGPASNIRVYYWFDC